MPRRRTRSGSSRRSPPTFIPVSAIDGIVRVLECPQCHGIDLYYEAGLITGYKYHCKTCNYIGAFVIERELEVPRRPAEE